MRRAVYSMMSATIRMLGLGRVDVGVADHELFEDVVLDGPGELLLGDALLLGGDDVAGQDRQHRAVHGHRHASSGRAGCRRRGSSCPRRSRSRRRPCRRRRRRAGGRCRSRGGWRGRTPPTGPSARRRGWPGRRRSTPRRWRSPAYWRIVHGRLVYIVARTPRTNGSNPGSESDAPRALEVVGGVERLDRDALGRDPRRATRDRP